jgi:L-serine dehydratase
MIRILSINGTEVNIEGDSYEILIWSSDKKILEEIAGEASWTDEILIHRGPEYFLEMRSRHAPDQDWLAKTRQKPNIRLLSVLYPVLPILANAESSVPFRTCQDLLALNEKEALTPWEFALAYESARGGIRTEEAWQMMEERYKVIKGAVEEGLRGTNYHDRLLPSQSPTYREQMEKGKLSRDETLHRITLYVTALMEVKSSMGVIVAAPTAGSCGTFPGAVLGLADSLGSSHEEIIRALLSGSLVGLFIAGASTFSAEIGGCQAECGAGAGMAAAALVYLLGGSLDQSMAAASMALQNSLGMICDPIAARVEAPCLGKNVSSAANALSCANMLMAGYKELIPLDEVIETMDRVGRSLPFELRCTALGGLSVTPSAKKLEKRMKK